MFPRRAGFSTPTVVRKTPISGNFRLPAGNIDIIMSRPVFEQDPRWFIVIQ